MHAANDPERALQMAQGKCIVNSINLEDGEKRFDVVYHLLSPRQNLRVRAQRPIAQHMLQFAPAIVEVDARLAPGCIFEGCHEIAKAGTLKVQ